MDDHQDMRPSVNAILDSLVTCRDLQSIILDFAYFRAILSEEQSRMVFKELSTDWVGSTLQHIKEDRKHIYYIDMPDYKKSSGRIILSGIIRNDRGFLVSVYYIYYYNKSIKDCWGRQGFDYIEWILESDPDLYSKMMKMQSGSRNAVINLLTITS